MGEQPYTLEVSSPGVARPLTEPRHFRRNVGRLVTVHHDGGEVTGRVTGASDTEVTVEVPATKAAPARTETLRYAAVERAVVQVEFARPDQSKDS
jgi:ribosome maturation factor RimP